MSCTPEDRKVMTHLVRLIQDSPDVRYFVGGAHTTMRELLVSAIKASGYDGDPVEVLRPPEHRQDERPQHQKLSEELESLRAAARAYLYDDRENARAALEALV